MKPLRALPITGFILAAAFQAATAVIPPLKLDRSLVPPPMAASGNNPDGGFQGYSVAADGNLTVVGAPMAESNWISAGSVKVFDTASGQLLHYLPNPEPSLNDYFGAAVALSGNLLLVGAPLDDTGATNSGRAYVFDLHSPMPASPVAVLENPTPGNGDQFGFAVAISERKLVVASHLDDSRGNDAGIVYWYDLDNPESLTSPGTLNHPSPAAGDWFGYSVAASGNRVIIGTPRDDPGAADAGSAFVYNLAGAVPGTPVAAMTNPGPAASDNFGCSVAISGSRAVVGCNKDNTGAADAGSAYVYDLEGATPDTPITVLNNPSPAPGDEFGGAVAVAANIVIVGARMDDAGAANAGSACVFSLDAAASAVPVLIIANPEPAADDQFGNAVAASGNHVVIGAWLDDLDFNPTWGVARVYDLTRPNPALASATLDAPLPYPGENFGASVAVNGSLAAVGAPHHRKDWSGFESGIVHVYDMTGASPSLPSLSLENPDDIEAEMVADRFGASIAMSGTRIVVGAPGHAGGAETEVFGIIHVFDLSGTSPGTPALTLENPVAGAMTGFGGTVAIDGPVVVAGTPQDSTTASNAGRILVYDLSGPAADVPALTLDPPDPAAGDQFGSAVAKSGTRIVVGAPERDAEGFMENAGAAYVFDLASPTPAVPVLTIPNPDPIDRNEFFGHSVAIEGTKVVVGAIGRFNPEAVETMETGIAYVFDLTSPTPATPVHILENPQPFANDHFGDSVAVSGPLVAVGAPGDGNFFDDALIDQAMVCVYDLTSAAPASPVATLENPRPVTQISQTSYSNYGHAVAISGNRIVVGAFGDDCLTSNQGAAHVYGAPEISIEADGIPVADEGSHSLGAVPVGMPESSTFVIRNSGSAGLALAGIGVSGGNTADFVVTPPVPGEIRPNAAVSFGVTFTPSAAGARATTLLATSDDADEGAYDINLTGTGLSYGADTDGDGMNDAAEYRMAALGFHWDTAEPAKVRELVDHASDAGLFTREDIQAQEPAAPLIQRDPLTGRFTLNLVWEKSTDLENFVILPAVPHEVSVTAQGDIQFEFDSNQTTEFYRIKVE